MTKSCHFPFVHTSSAMTHRSTQKATKSRHTYCPVWRSPGSQPELQNSHLPCHPLCLLGNKLSSSIPLPLLLQHPRASLLRTRSRPDTASSEESAHCRLLWNTNMCLALNRARHGHRSGIKPHSRTRIPSSYC